jgi:ketosteroid isomerase-like protein
MDKILKIKSLISLSINDGGTNKAIIESVDKVVEVFLRKKRNGETNDVFNFYVIFITLTLF